jgi:Thioredoxin-like domain
MNNLHKRLNLAANLMIVLVSLSIGVVLIKHYWHASGYANPPRDYGVPAGSTVSLPGVDWEKNEQTLLLVLDTGCAYCTASSALYQQIVREAAQHQRVKLIAVLPQDVSNSKQYLSDLNVSINDVRQSSLQALGVKGTPTLILVNSKAEVVNSWPGKLPPAKEREVLRHIGFPD